VGLISNILKQIAAYRNPHDQNGLTEFHA